MCSVFVKIIFLCGHTQQVINLNWSPNLAKAKLTQAKPSGWYWQTCSISCPGHLLPSFWHFVTGWRYLEDIVLGRGTMSCARVRRDSISRFHWQWQWVRMFHERRSRGVMRRLPGVMGDPTPPLPPTLLTQGSADLLRWENIAEMNRPLTSWLRCVNENSWKKRKNMKE